MKATKEQIDRAQSIIEAHAITPRHVVEEALNAALALLQSSAPEWKTMDSAPNDGTHILARWPVARQPAFETYWDSDETQGDKPGWYAPGWGHVLDGLNPVGWMPLPGSLASPALIAQLEAVAGLAEKASEAPWVVWPRQHPQMDYYVGPASSSTAAVCRVFLDTVADPANAAFIAAVRSLPFAEIVVALRGRP